MAKGQEECTKFRTKWFCIWILLLPFKMLYSPYYVSKLHYIKHNLGQKGIQIEKCPIAVSALSNNVLHFLSFWLLKNKHTKKHNNKNFGIENYNKKYMARLVFIFKVQIIKMHNHVLTSRNLDISLTIS